MRRMPLCRGVGVGDGDGLFVLMGEKCFLYVLMVLPFALERQLGLGWHPSGWSGWSGWSGCVAGGGGVKYLQAHLYRRMTLVR